MACCKPFELHFSIDQETLYRKITDLITTHNGHLCGTSSSGSFAVPLPTAGQLEGSYVIDSQVIRLSISKRPRLLPCAMIESFFRKNLPRLEETVASQGAN